MRRKTVQELAVGAAALLAVVATITSCGVGESKITEPFKDAPRGQTLERPVDVITMPDGFSNIATVCGTIGMRYTTIFHNDAAYGAVSVTPDPSCR